MTPQSIVTPSPLLDVTNLTKHFVLSRRAPWAPAPSVKAVDGVSFALDRGETLSLVGESGCGKTTTGKSVLRLIEPSGGSIRLDGEDVLSLSPTQMRRRRRDMQIVFQDPYASLNPRLPAGEIVAEPLRNFDDPAWRSARQREDRIAWLFSRVGLRPEAMRKLPAEFSGGQRQRLGIARALALNPKLIVCDEPVSALDVSVQAQVVNLLMDLQAEFGIAYLFVAHDLAVVRHISHRVAVMYLGRIVEIADRDTLFNNPAHPYTRMLLSSVPSPRPGAKAERVLPLGDPPSPFKPPSGCGFHPRCPFARAECRETAPALAPPAAGGPPSHRVACHLAA
ncbi:ABC transporter ATP-binding protein (plasmid) [Azospirillum oryzae]|uniref:ABC transporter ATP-binding protein n=1 Tax=Azospirillum oryzae TaxID=286727 RepID=A0A6N1AGA1_9PROT|nr:ABC transporter ATP-binding protein [Azospirillum oryzae]KAA0587376.1 ABC transporter ATP-binding protein [Azospirillum oryzae]QKS50566.1 ABC transporter ATP-binding protein [Azospirillum oryzae]GLR79135.1 peptide ABC transporter ATP-binding protein [Azospirillum oryzae]